MFTKTSVFDIAKKQRQAAQNILEELRLIEKWQHFGRPIIVGAMAYDLMIDVDIDIEIYCPDLKIEHGFKVLSECAQNMKVKQIEYVNALESDDKALYWQIKYQESEGITWKIDMWSAPEDYNLPRSEDFILPMQEALTEETREAILRLKLLRNDDPSFQCLSIDLYRAVLEDNVRKIEELKQWIKVNDIGKLTNWKPSKGKITKFEQPT
ncbi:MAG: hypothetical protein PHW79_05340 [Candidatus Marinimicrobia bacterium]|nr:hypothetical protein [Candidatus Neomarinimicrobiota bacterium]